MNPGMKTLRRTAAIAATAIVTALGVVTAAPASANSYTWQGIRRCKFPYVFVWSDDDLRLEYSAKSRRADAVDLQTDHRIHTVKVEEFKSGGRRVDSWSRTIDVPGGRFYINDYRSGGLRWLPRSAYSRFRVTLTILGRHGQTYTCYNDWAYNGGTTPSATDRWTAPAATVRPGRP